MWNDFKNFLLAFYVLVKRIVQVIISSIVKLYTFIQPVKDSLRGMINVEECYRVLILSLSAGGTFAGSINYVSKNFTDFVTDPVLSVAVQSFIKHCNDKHLTIAIFIVVFLCDYIRRKYAHGNSQ